MRYSDADHRLLSALRDCGAEPRVAAVARAFSFAGEHGAVWLAGGALAAAVDRERRGGWLRGAALVGAAHLASMGVKRVVRRPRPRLAAREPLVRTAGRHSFPSSHATSAAAAAVAYGALRPAGARLVPPLAAAMCVSRLVVGVHYPSDVLVGALLGAVTARLGAGWVGNPQPLGRPRFPVRPALRTTGAPS
ncbi:phosphatase PAP2 family protein [Streptomyces sp. BPTC-684]|uniref:phosphatase PAP2 family protein n=1 Tax=Streptomyces sp. BPTC-684 TaxID=3043734 RepID=UPI0024B1F322|nr:phosphatase PAP2 family protein [Streptomyces sp. BPTC-684]WHM37044.1 phosphatase PAP2 family protein [Streptomyces sp. BPTC-684]